MKFMCYARHENLDGVFMGKYKIDTMMFGIYLHEVYIELYKLLLKWGPSGFYNAYKEIEDSINKNDSDRNVFKDISSDIYSSLVLEHMYENIASHTFSSCLNTGFRLTEDRHIETPKKFHVKLIKSITGDGMYNIMESHINSVIPIDFIDRMSYAMSRFDSYIVFSEDMDSSNDINKIIYKTKVENTDDIKSILKNINIPIQSDDEIIQCTVYFIYTHNYDISLNRFIKYIKHICSIRYNINTQTTESIIKQIIDDSVLSIPYNSDTHNIICDIYRLINDADVIIPLIFNSFSISKISLSELRSDKKGIITVDLSPSTFSPGNTIKCCECVMNSALVVDDNLFLIEYISGTFSTLGLLNGKKAIDSVDITEYQKMIKYSIILRRVLKFIYGID